MSASRKWGYANRLTSLRNGAVEPLIRVLTEKRLASLSFYLGKADILAPVWVDTGAEPPGVELRAGPSIYIAAVGDRAVEVGYYSGRGDRVAIGTITYEAPDEDWVLIKGVNRLVGLASTVAFMESPGVPAEAREASAIAASEAILYILASTVDKRTEVKIHVLDEVLDAALGASTRTGLVAGLLAFAQRQLYERSRSRSSLGLYFIASAASRLGLLDDSVTAGAQGLVREIVGIARDLVSGRDRDAYHIATPFYIADKYAQLLLKGLGLCDEDGCSKCMKEWVDGPYILYTGSAPGRECASYIAGRLAELAGAQGSDLKKSIAVALENMGYRYYTNPFMVKAGLIYAAGLLEDSPGFVEKILLGNEDRMERIEAYAAAFEALTGWPRWASDLSVTAKATLMEAVIEPAELNRDENTRVGNISAGHEEWKILAALAEAVTAREDWALVYTDPLLASAGRPVEIVTGEAHPPVEALNPIYTAGALGGVAVYWRRSLNSDPPWRRAVKRSWGYDIIASNPVYTATQLVIEDRVEDARGVPRIVSTRVRREYTIPLPATGIEDVMKLLEQDARAAVILYGPGNRVYGVPARGYRHVYGGFIEDGETVVKVNQLVYPQYLKPPYYLLRYYLKLRDAEFIETRVFSSKVLASMAERGVLKRLVVVSNKLRPEPLQGGLGGDTGEAIMVPVGGAIALVPALLVSKTLDGDWWLVIYYDTRPELGVEVNGEYIPPVTIAVAAPRIRGRLGPRPLPVIHGIVEVDATRTDNGSDSYSWDAILINSYQASL